MQKNRSSETAKGIAMYRMIESVRSEKDRVFFDPYAQIFLESKWKKRIQSPIRLALLKFLGNLKYPGFRGSLATRFRFMNESIKGCFPGDFSQLVILGAGYDMSAYCFRDDLVDATIFEVDHPNTQKEKQTKIKKHVKNIPKNITYVPINFETDDLKESLSVAGYHKSEKTLFIMEGVTYYLEKESLEKTLGFIVKNSEKGSKFAFDFFSTEIIDGTSTDRLGKAMLQLVTKMGEPYKFGIEKDQIKPYLKHHGFSDVFQTSSKEVKDLYFHGKNKNRKISDLFNFVCATT